MALGSDDAPRDVVGDQTGKPLVGLTGGVLVEQDASPGSQKPLDQLPLSDWVRLWTNIKVKSTSPDLARQMQLATTETALRSATLLTAVGFVAATANSIIVHSSQTSVARTWNILMLLVYVGSVLGLVYLNRRRRRGSLTAAAFNKVLGPSALGGAVLWGLSPLTVAPDDNDNIHAAATFALVVALIGFFWPLGHWVISVVYTSTILFLLGVSFYVLDKPQWINMLFLYPVFVAAVVSISAFATYGIAHARFQMLLANEREQFIRVLVNDYERGGHEWLWEVDAELNFTRVPPRMAIAAVGDARFAVGGNLRAALAAHPSAQQKIDERQPFQVTVSTRGPESAGEMRLWGRPTTSHGILLGYRGVGSDEAAARRARDAERASERLDAMVSVTSGLAHDFNNQLATILSAVELAGFDPHIGSTTKATLATAVDACLRTRRMTSDLVVASGHDASYQPQSLEVGDAITSVQSEIASLYPRIRIEVDAPEPTWVHTDASHFARAIRNLVENACQAITEQTTPDSEGAGRGWVIVSVRQDVAVDASSAVVRIADSGPGFPAEARSRLFEPFVTTRRACGGSGLGLAIARGFATQAGGRLLLESSVSGAVFRLELPCRPPEAVSDPAPPARGALVAPAAKVASRILVVEDDRSVADNLVKLLRSFGAEVRVAHSLSEAVTDFISHADQFDCLISDLVLPDGDGFEVVGRFRSKVPGLTAIYMSGFTRTLPAAAAPHLRCPFLAKPFSISELVDVLVEAGVPFADTIPVVR